MRQLDGKLTVGDLEIAPMQVWHGSVPVIAYRMGRFAYVTDASEIPQETLDQLVDLDTLVINALRYKPHVTHLSIEQAVEVVQHLRPRRAYFTHMTHDVDY
ncbi:MBL fold metallo-hydrolase, partial [PVC group bacterium]|nr:MBL fold metallo-hydrolase [PVC group bacterium]